MTALVIAEHDNRSIRPATLNAVAAAAQMDADVHVLVAGSGSQAAAEAASKIAGVAKVLHADAPHLDHALAENVAAQVLALVKGGAYGHVVFPATAAGRNVAPRVAALLDVAQVSDITKVVSPDTFERPIYAGNAIATVQSPDKVKVLTVRATGFDAAAAEGGSARRRAGRGDARRGPHELRRRRDREERPPRADGGQDHRLGRARARQRGEVHRAARRRWPTSSAPRSARAARRSTRATRPTTGRSARPARSSRPSSTSPAASRARSSTWRA